MSRWDNGSPPLILVPPLLTSYIKYNNNKNLVLTLQCNLHAYKNQSSCLLCFLSQLKFLWYASYCPHRYQQEPKSNSGSQNTALALAGMGLTFLTSAPLGLCLGSVAKTVWITHRCFGYWWAVLAQPPNFLFSLLCPPQRVGRGGQELAKDTTILQNCIVRMWLAQKQLKNQGLAVLQPNCTFNNHI